MPIRVSIQIECSDQLIWVLLDNQTIKVKYMMQKLLSKKMNKYLSYS